MDIYAENILEHYKNPTHQEPVKNPSVTHEEINHSCGDSLNVQIKIEHEVIKQIGWSGTGCAISQAAMSLLCEEAEGKTIAEVLKIYKPDILKMLGVPIGTRRFKCATLGLHTLKNALLKFKGEKPQGWLETVGEP